MSMYLQRARARDKLNFLNHQPDPGWFLRAMHGWGPNFMVAVVLVHMAQVFMFGSLQVST
jgi:ubiquinol-cytochrome c reductase cytochrome b subunit